MVRRWPIVTAAIILICLGTFIGTNSAIHNDSDNKQLLETRNHILILSARFPDLPMRPKAQEMVERFKRENPDVYAQLASSQRQSPIDAWEAQLLMNPEWDRNELAAEMNELCKKWEETPTDSFLWKYAYHSEEPTPWSYITSAFLHGGWIHLIMNMWFLYLVGALLEDAWGHITYTLFYLAAGAVAAYGYGLAHPHSLTNLIGASGAVAGLMGAFIVRFPKSQIRVAMIWFSSLVSGKMRDFVMPAWAFLLIWISGEVLYSIFQLSDQVAHFAHVSGFIFGVAVAAVLRLTPLERVVNPEDPSKTWTPDQEVLDAIDLLNQRQPDQAQALLEDFLSRNPNSIDGHETMLKVHTWKGDTQGELQTLAVLAGLHLGKGDPESAWNCYEQFRQAQGAGFPIAVWSWLARYLERQENWERAAAEYERIASEYPGERASLDAMMAAARIYLTKLNAPSKAERHYRAVANSTIPHLDLEMMIQAGLQQCAQGVRTAGASSNMG